MSVQLAAIESLAETGNLKGAKAINLLTNLLDSDSEEGRLTAIRAIETARFTDAAPRLAQSLTGKTRPPAERVAILKALRVLNDRNTAAALKKIVEDSEPAFLRTEALRSLAVLDPAEAQSVAIKLLDQSDGTLQSEAVQILGAKPEGAMRVGRHFLERKLPRELLPQVSEALRKHTANRPEIAKLLSEVMKGGLLLALNPGEIEKNRQLVLARGDARRGKSIYLNSKALACVTCHKLDGIGGQVGPDLTRIWETSTIEKIMEAIIDPGKEIKEGFQSFKVVNKNGQTYTGLKVVDKPAEIVLRDANGKDLRFTREDIESIEASNISLMPDNVVAQLSFDQFIDLIAFLKSRDAQESLRGMATEFWVIGPFGDDLRAEYGPETKTDEKADYLGLSNRKLTWQARNVDPNGFLDLRAVIDRDRVSAYALTYVYSPKAQAAAMYVGADDTVRVWINGQMIHEHTGPRTAVPDQDRVAVELKEGWNPIVVKVVNRLDAHGLFLRFQGEGVRASIKRE